MAVLFGDTSGSLTGRQHGAAQTLVGSDPTNTLFGDAGVDLLGRAIGGNDTLLTSGSGSLYGDAGGNISDHARGGSDTLSAQGATRLSGYGRSQTAFGPIPSCCIVFRVDTRS